MNVHSEKKKIAGALRAALAGGQKIRVDLLVSYDPKRMGSFWADLPLVRGRTR